MRLRLKVLETVSLDEHTIAAFGEKNRCKDSIFVYMNGIREYRKGNTKKENTKKKGKLTIYRREDLLKYYSEDRGELKLDETKEFIIYEKRELIFIPLCNIDHNIVAYSIVSLSDYDKIKGKSFYRKVGRRKGSKTYVRMCGSNTNLHEIIFGRPAKKGGWEKIENYVETEESLKAVWIKSVGVPPPYLGKNWNFCRDENNTVYIKMPGCALDHRNLDTLDNRRINLREAIFSLNAANKKKKEGCVSKFFGVSRIKNKWRGSLKFNGTGYSRTFDSEKDAATFRDMYCLVFYKDIICNNGMLNEEQIQDILQKGESAIPENFRICTKKDRELPKYIIFHKGLYRVGKQFMNKFYHMNFNTLEEAIAALPELHATIKRAKDEYRTFIEKRNAHLFFESEGYGILEARDKFGEVQAKAIVNVETWKKFIHINWTLSGSNRLLGFVNGVKNEVHVHVYREHHPDYHKSTHGTVDHIDGDKDNVSDCRIENLRPASDSQQNQNKECWGTLPYKGVAISGEKFYAIFGWQGKQTRGERRIYIEDAARDYNAMALEKWEDAYQNIVPDTKTTAEFFYHKSKLTVEKIENLITTEVISILFINSEWAELCNLTIAEIFDINRKSLDKYKKLIMEWFLDEQREEREEREEDNEDEDNEDEDEDNEDEDNEDEDEDNEDEDEDNEDEDNKNEYEANGEEDNESECEENEDDEGNKKVRKKKRQYIPMEIIPEDDASDVQNLCYGYTKRFDRSKIVIDEVEARIIRLIFSELDKGLKKEAISKILNSQNLKKNEQNWTPSKVYAVIILKTRYQGSLVEGRLCRYPKIL